MKLNRIGRKINNTAHSIVRSMNQDGGTVKRDYAERVRKNNPMFVSRPQKNLGLYVRLFLVVGLFLATVMIILVHPFFRVKQIFVSGTNRVDNAEVVKTLEGILDGRCMIVFSNRNYFLTDVIEIREILRSRFPIAEIVVKKTFPNKVDVELKEKITRIIFDNGKRYAFLNESGQVLEVIRSVGEDEWKKIPGTVYELAVSSTVSSTISTSSITLGDIYSKYHVPNVGDIRKLAGDYPILYDARTNTVNFVSSSPTLEKGETVVEDYLVKRIIEWYGGLIKVIGENKIDYFVIQNDVGFGEVRLRDGSYIKLNLIVERPSAIEAIDLLLHEKIKGGKFEYLDVRYPGRVYWK